MNTLDNFVGKLIGVVLDDNRSSKSHRLSAFAPTHRALIVRVEWGREEWSLGRCFVYTYFRGRVVRNRVKNYGEIKARLLLDGQVL